MSTTRELLVGTTTTLSDGGSLQLIDVMGSDRRIVDAARISYGRRSKYDAADKKLLRYLMRHRHTSPFEQCEVTFIVRCPMDTWRQWIRHRTASVNEYSTRYTDAIDEMAVTQPEDWRIQNTANRQGSEGEVVRDTGQYLCDREGELHNLAREIYKERLSLGVAREQARKDLPLSTFTKAYWKIDLHNLLHFLELRMDEHAQLEIRRYADAIFNVYVRKLFPWTAEAFEDYRLNAITFTRAELTILRDLTNVRVLFETDEIVGTYLSGREETEFWGKLRKLTHG